MSFGSSWRDVYLATGARGASVCGDFLAATALVLTLQTAGHGGLAVTGVLMAEAVPLVLLAPLAGRLVDRADSRALLVTVSLGQTAVCALLAYTSNLAIMIALVAVLTCGLAITSPTLATLIPEMVHRDDLPRASAVNQTASAVGLLLGPALAGVLVGGYGSRPALLIDAASYLAITGAGLSIRTRRRSGEAGSAPAGGPPVPTDMSTDRPSRSRLRDDGLLRPLLLALGVVVASVTAINVVAVFFVRETLGASATTYGLVEAAWTGGMLAGAWMLARWLRPTPDDAALGIGTLLTLGGSCAAVLLGAAVPAAGWLLPIWFFGGVTNGATNTAVSVLIAQRVPRSWRGRAYSMVGAVAQGGSVVGYLLGGALLTWFAPRPLVALAGLGGLLATALTARKIAIKLRTERSVGYRQLAAARRCTRDHVRTPRGSSGPHTRLKRRFDPRRSPGRVRPDGGG